MRGFRNWAFGGSGQHLEASLSRGFSLGPWDVRAFPVEVWAWEGFTTSAPLPSSILTGHVAAGIKMQVPGTLAPCDDTLAKDV